MKFHNIITASAILIVLSTGTATAVPFTFTPGQPARAADVNANFAELEAQIEDNAAAIAAIPITASYDYRDYSADPSITSKTFAITGISSCDTEVQNLAHNTVGDTTTLTLTRIRTQASNPCQYHVYTMQATSTGYYMVSEAVYNFDGSIAGQATTLDKPVLLRSTNMIPGMSTADAATTSVVNGGSSVGTFVEKTTLAGIEDVTVPYNGGTTYNDCLKLHIQRSSSTGFNNFERVSWFCAGVGFVKGIQGAGATWELTDIANTP